ncbi:MAG: hypothetical protein S4CHLAM6_14320 [Chlamydiae bacterium]|nr:hypothetical protein [Chlamydiota bacterium]
MSLRLETGLSSPFTSQSYSEVKSMMITDSQDPMACSIELPIEMARDWECDLPPASADVQEDELSLLFREGCFLDESAEQRGIRSEQTSNIFKMSFESLREEQADRPVELVNRTALDPFVIRPASVGLLRSFNKHPQIIEEELEEELGEELTRVDPWKGRQVSDLSAVRTFPFGSLDENFEGSDGGLRVKRARLGEWEGDEYLDEVVFGQVDPVGSTRATLGSVTNMLHK